MRIAIAGAGAVGSVIAAYLLKSGGHEVSLLGRGAHLAAIRRHGLTVHSRGERLSARPRASDDPAELGPQDLIVATVKAHGVPALAPMLTPMRKAETLVVALQNGIPWWYFHGEEGPEAGQPFETVDPGGVAWRTIGPEHAIGCTVSLPAALAEPGIVNHGGTLRMALGAPRAGDHADALRDIAAVFRAAGFDLSTPEYIRQAVWMKLRLNVPSGPIAVLTGATLGALDAAPSMRQLRRRIMEECHAVAAAWGIALPNDIEERLDAGIGNPNHRESMLQDFEAGRRIELDAIVASVIELARRRHVPVPSIEMIWSLTRLREATSRHKSDPPSYTPVVAKPPP